MTIAIWALWIWLGELSWFKIFVWFGYLFALQAGYLTGAYIASRRDGGSGRRE